MTPGYGVALGAAIGRLLALLFDRHNEPDPLKALQLHIRALEAEARVRREAKRRHAERRAGQ